MNSLNARERTLLWIVLSFLPLTGLYYGWTSYQSMRAYRQDQILEAEQRKQTLKSLAWDAERELDRLDEAYNEASLPLNVAENTAAYQNFLSTLIAKHTADFSLGTVKLETIEYDGRDEMNRVVKQPAFDRVRITDIAFKGTPRQVLGFLYDFYDLAMLHRIDTFSCDLESPDKEELSILQLKFSVSAIILPSAPEMKSWSEYATGRLGKSLEVFESQIVARNLFGPPNEGPRLTSRTSLELEVDDSLSHRVTASDGNEDDLLTFELLESELAGVTLEQSSADSRNATLRGPRISTPGRFRFKIGVHDGRLPQLSDEQILTVTVSDPPPPRDPPPRDPTPPPKYAADTYITSLLQDRDGVASVVINIRPEDEILRVKEGDSFELDDKQWHVVKVDRRTVTLRVEDELLQFKIGSSLADPHSVSKAVTVAD